MFALRKCIVLMNIDFFICKSLIFSHEFLHLDDPKGYNYNLNLLVYQFEDLRTTFISHPKKVMLTHFGQK